jgi:hypothetical protein
MRSATEGVPEVNAGRAYRFPIEARVENLLADYEQTIMCGDDLSGTAISTPQEQCRCDRALIAYSLFSGTKKFVSLDLHAVGHVRFALWTRKMRV